MTTLTPSPSCRALVASFEGCKLHAYPDPGSDDGNPWTIGYGATGDGIRKGVTWTQAQANARLDADLALIGRGVSGMLQSAPTTQHEFDALVSFAFNVGLAALRRSTLLVKHLRGDHAGARAEFAKWNKNDGRVMAGLTRRRAAEAELYRSMKR